MSKFKVLEESRFSNEEMADIKGGTTCGENGTYSDCGLLFKTSCRTGITEYYDSCNSEAFNTTCGQQVGYESCWIVFSKTICGINTLYNGVIM